MDSKLISLLGVMAIMVAGWFFYRQEVKIEPALPETPTPSYEVEKIEAVQTNPETGKVEYTLTADSLVQNSAGEEEMIHAKIDWHPPQAANFNLVASRATFNQTTGDINLLQSFLLVRQADDTTPEMVIEGTTLFGNSKNHTIYSQEPIQITQGTDSFTAKSFTANLQQGVYEFHQIEMVFDPPKRTDKPLF